MSMLLFKKGAHQGLLMCSLLLGLAQAGCAHPVFVEPSVMVHSRFGLVEVHAQTGGSQVIHAPPPRVIYLPPPPPLVVYVPPIYRPAPAWHHGHNGHEDRSDRGRWGRHNDRRSHGGHDDWRR